MDAGTGLDDLGEGSGAARTRGHGGLGLGGDYDTITVSGLYRRSAADAARSAGTAPVIAKESATGDGPMAFVQATGVGDTLAVALAGNSFQFPNIEDRRQLAVGRRRRLLPAPRVRGLRVELRPRRRHAAVLPELTDASGHVTRSDTRTITCDR